MLVDFTLDETGVLFGSPGTNKWKNYGCSKFRKSPYIYIEAATLMGKRMPTGPFSHITQQKILQLLWYITLFSLVQITSNLAQKHIAPSYANHQIGKLTGNPWETHPRRHKSFPWLISSTLIAQKTEGY